MNSIINFLFENKHDQMTIDFDEFRKDLLRTSRCKRKDQIKTRSISIEKLIKLLNAHRDEKSKKQQW